MNSIPYEPNTYMNYKTIKIRATHTGFYFSDGKNRRHFEVIHIKEHNRLGSINIILCKICKRI